jgi:hypothetical protein
MLLNKATNECQKGLMEFMKYTFEGTSRRGTAPCPCPKCCCMAYRTGPRFKVTCLLEVLMQISSIAMVMVMVMIQMRTTIAMKTYR